MSQNQHLSPSFLTRIAIVLLMKRPVDVSSEVFISRRLWRRLVVTFEVLLMFFYHPGRQTLQLAGYSLLVTREQVSEGEQVRSLDNDSCLGGGDEELLAIPMKEDMPA